MVDDIDAAEEWLNTWTASVNAQAERAAQLTSRVAALTAHAESSDGSIKVTVGSTGQIEKLALDDRVQRLSGEELSRQIMTVMRKAQASLTTLVASEVAATRTVKQSVQPTAADRSRIPVVALDRPALRPLKPVSARHVCAACPQQVCAFFLAHPTLSIPAAASHPSASRLQSSQPSLLPTET